MDQPTPAAGAQQPETDEQRADRLETERDHAAGDHQHCGLTCETAFPSEVLRNGILWRAAPGSARMLDELLRRAGQARGTTGQDTTVPADGEQGTRQQIAELTDTDRQFLRFALDEAADLMATRDGFTDDDHAALDKLRRLAADPEPAA